MTEFSLEQLGLSEDALAERLVNKITENLMTSLDYDEEDGEWRSASPFAKKLDRLVTARLDKLVNDLADKHVLPKVSELVENLVLQKTNSWGEKVGEPVTFIEYLVQRADAYMSEPVDYNGNANTGTDYNWRKSTTRISYMVDQHLQYSISVAMKRALEDANNSIVGGLEEAVKTSLKSVQEKLQVTVKTK